MKQFAKLFDTQQCGQIVAIAGKDDDENPAIRIMFKPAGLGVCEHCLSFHDTSEGRECRDEAFNELDEEIAVDVVKPIMDMISQAFPADADTGEIVQ